MKKCEKKIDRANYFPPEKGWKTVVDFTDGGRTEGVSAEEVIRFLKKISKQS